MMQYRKVVEMWLVFFLLVCCQSADPQTEGTASLIHISNGYVVIPNITYRTASNVDLKLDIYEPIGPEKPNSVLVFYHGGGWTAGTKEGVVLWLLPYLQTGWTVVNVEYRLTSAALAPAAVEDARCALRWIYRNAKAYDFDTTKIVTSGQSAGGHLALMVGMLPGSTEFDNTCPGARDGGASGTGPHNTDELKVAAVVDWYGISDVHELLSGTEMRPYTVAWMGSLPYREDLAKHLSPEAYVRSGLPPIISVHGDADPSVPYTQKQRLHAALEKAGVAHELVTIRGGKHGGFSDADSIDAYAKIRAFLAKYNLTPAS